MNNQIGAQKGALKERKTQKGAQIRGAQICMFNRMYDIQLSNWSAKRSIKGTQKTQKGAQIMFG